MGIGSTKLDSFHLVQAGVLDIGNYEFKCFEPGFSLNLPGSLNCQECAFVRWRNGISPFPVRVCPSSALVQTGGDSFIQGIWTNFPTLAQQQKIQGEQVFYSLLFLNLFFYLFSASYQHKTGKVRTEIVSK